MENTIDNLRFIWTLDNSVGFKVIYFIEKVIGKFFHSFRIIKEDYILNAKDFSWLIKARSDMDYIARPNYEKELIPYFKCDGVFIDIREHMGKWTLFMSKRASEVYSFEPNPSTYGYLKSNLLINNTTNVHAVQSAVSDINGTVRFSPDPVDTGASMMADGDIEVPCTTLDSFTENIPHIGLIKIDAQEQEIRILNGAKKTLEKTDRVICEISNKTEVEKQGLFDYMALFRFSSTQLPTKIDYLFYK